MRTAGVLLILVCAAALPVSAQESTEGEAATVIRALEHQWFEAQSRHDNRALDLIFDNALVYVEYGRLITKGDYLLQVKAAKPGTSQISMETMTVRTFGEAAIVVGTYRDHSPISGKSVRWRFVDTWVRKNGRWVLVAAAAAPFAK